MLRSRQHLLIGRRRAHKVSVQLGSGDSLELKTGHMARFADAAVVASQGDSAVLATCVYRHNSSSTGFTPLTVDFKQSASAVGRIPTNYLRRELGQSDADVLTSRVIDRSLRPLFPAGWGSETQVICKPLALDDGGDAVILGINAAAAAVHVSSVPFDGPVAAVRVGMIGGQPILNPSLEERRASQLDLVVSGRDGEKVVMIEMDGQQIDLDLMERAVDVAMRGVDQLLAAQVELRGKAGKKKALCTSSLYDAQMIDEIRELSVDRLYYVLTDANHDKTSRDVAIREIGSDVVSSLAGADSAKAAKVQMAYSRVVKQELRNHILDSGMRCDGRGLTDFRPISIDVDVYRKLHGSALFQRGQTQVLSTVTFDSPSAAFHPDSVSQLLGAQQRKQFMLHYEFPAYATNELQTGRGVNRRELGHGALAEKALRHVVPGDFPYAIRLACQVLESNGSSSMASAIGGSLALMDAGVPLKNPVAGVAIGLVTGEEGDAKRRGQYRILTDILGIEDYAGDMDFKVAGTSSGLTAAQLDVKMAGLTRRQLSEALQRAQAGLEHVLAKMDAAIARPRPEFKSTVPVMETMPLEIYKRHALFRAGGLNAKLIEAETGVRISSEDDANIALCAPNRDKMRQAKEMLSKLLQDNSEREYAFGQLIQAEVLELLDKGITVRLEQGGRPYFMPNSQLHPHPIQHASAIGIKAGQRFAVQYLGRDKSNGQVRLSRRTVNNTQLPVYNKVGKK